MSTDSGAGSHEPAIREAHPSDVAQAAALLAQAFQTDPVYQWMSPDEDLRQRALPHLFASLLRRVHLRHRATDLAIIEGCTAGVAVWDPPGKWRTPVWRQMTQLPDLLRAFGRSTPTMVRGFSALAEIEKRHPDAPHWYLVDVATSPAHRRQGLGRRLLTARLDHCDTVGSPAYLEASSRTNARLYERLGFQTVGEITLPEGPTVLPMWREPLLQDR